MGLLTSIGMKTCKVCKEEKTADYDKMGKNGAKLYTDEKGRLWKGACCPVCQAVGRKADRKYIKENTKKTEEII